MTRSPFQGVSNIIRFNWHFYVIAGLLFIFGMVLIPFLSNELSLMAYLVIGFASLQIIVSLLVSWWVYDRSGLYDLNWLTIPQNGKVLSLNAGFDETSQILIRKFPEIQLTVGDFFDPRQHTEVSLQRARAAYPPFRGTINLSTTDLPFEDHSFEVILAILSAHEIRNDKERVLFFKALYRVLKPGGKVYITEHLRDGANFLAYSIGFLHFHSKKTWQSTFEKAGFTLFKTIKTTPFITTYILEVHGTTS